MPTGYTAGIEDGRITTGKDFLKLCTQKVHFCCTYKNILKNENYNQTTGFNIYKF